jgi:hypothetical protein
MCIIHLQYLHTKHQVHHTTYVLLYYITFVIDNTHDMRYNIHKLRHGEQHDLHSEM